MSLKPGGARLKGQRHEREVAKVFRTVVPEATRGIGQARGGGEEVADVTNLPFLHVECKHRQTVSIWAAMAQAENDASPGLIPTVVVKQNRRPNMAVMKLTDFVKLFGKLLTYKSIIRHLEIDEDEILKSIEENAKASKDTLDEALNSMKSTVSIDNFDHTDATPEEIDEVIEANPEGASGKSFVPLELGDASFKSEV